MEKGGGGTFTVLVGNMIFEKGGGAKISIILIL